ncbi:MAG TPA: hypothetical protein VH637_22560 [Streptosporangiaceae bacterium]
MIWSSHGAGRSRRLIVVAVAALIPLLAGCEAGNNAPTSEWHQPTEGASTVVGDIAVRNVFVLGPAIGGQIPAGQQASLFFAIVNTGTPDRLVGISAPGAATSVTLPSAPISLATNKAILLTGPAPQAVLSGLTRPLAGGGFVRLVMTFQNAGSVRLLVPVVPRARYFATMAPPPSPSPSPSPSSGRHQSPGASPSPGGTASPGTSTTPAPVPTSTP